MIDITLALAHLKPNDEWELNGDDYTGLTWISDTPKPTEQEITNAYPLAVAALDAEQATKDDARVSAVAKLAALGLNEAEVLSIVGSA